MKKYLFLFLLFFIPKAHAQIVPGEACKNNACYGYGTPSGAAPIGYIYQDLSQTPPALYCSKNSAWIPCGGSGSSGGVTSSIFYIASNCSALSNCLTWVDDDATDNCGSATTAFMSAINSYAGPGEAHVYVQGSGSGKAYKLTSCNLPFTGPSGTGGVAGSINITSNATLDCAQTGGNCIQMGKTGCATGLPPAFYGTGCHDVTWRGGTFVGCVGLSTACIEIEPGIAETIIDDVTFNNTGAGNATIGSCTNYSVQWDTFNGSPEFSRNKYYGTVPGQCFTNNNDQTGGANTIIYTNNTILHAGGSGACGSQGLYDSSSHSTIDNNTIYGFSSAITLASNGTGFPGSFLGDGGWMITGNNLDFSQGCNGAVNASIKFSGTVNDVGPVTLSNNNNQSTPLISRASGATVSMTGWEVVGNNTYANNSFLISGSSTTCIELWGVPCYLGANPGFPTTGSGGSAYGGFTVLGAAGTVATWPPSATGPTFSPSAGAVSSGTTVTTSCGTGSPFISAGTTPVAGGTGIAVTGAVTLFGSCQGSGNFTTGSAAYTLNSTTTYINTIFNEAGSGALAGTTPATCASGCVGPWALAGGADFAYQGGGGILASTINTTAPDLINVGHADATIRFTVSSIGTATLGQVFVRDVNANNQIAINICPSGVSDCGLGGSAPAGFGIFDVVSGTSTNLGSLAGAAAGNYVIVLSGNQITMTGPGGSIGPFTTGNTAGTDVGLQMQIGASFGLSSLSAKSN